MTNYTHIDKDFGWFIGDFDNNQLHKHYAIQLSIPMGEKIVLKTKEYQVESEHPILIKPNVAH